jgi:two-component system response regulator HydG
MPLPLQAKILRGLQDGEVRRIGENRAFAVDVRVICATHRDLAGRVREGQFREDLYYRLKVLTLEVPPLRNRRDDILPLALRFLGQEQLTSQTTSQMTSRAVAASFSAAARERFLAYPWPGNVRELQNVVKHGAALAVGEEVRDEDLPDDLRRANPASCGPLSTLAEVERAHILRVLDACGGSQADAARVLAIGRNTLWRKLRAMGTANATVRGA